VINNKFYDSLGKRWLTASDHPVALLRAENKIRTPWVKDEVAKRFPKKITFLDIGCGAGFLTNELAIAGHDVTGVDLSEGSLEVAREADKTQTVEYLNANAYALPFPDERFDVVAAMDVLEHVEEPRGLIREAGRVLKPGGSFFFHTFNRNPLSYLVIIKGVEWCVRNTPDHMHVYSLFIKPAELERYCRESDLQVETLLGLRPKFLSLPFLKMLLTRKVPDTFAFRFSKSLVTGYCGIAKKGEAYG